MFEKVMAQAENYEKYTDVPSLDHLTYPLKAEGHLPMIADAAPYGEEE